MKDEYLLVSQAAFLLKMKKQNFEALLWNKKIPYKLKKGFRLIKRTDFLIYVKHEMEKYDLAREYINANNKSSFWNLQNKVFQNQGLCHDHSMIEFLTVGQVAYLLHLSRQAVHGLLERQTMKKQYIESPRHKKPLVFIRADEVEKYVKNKDEKYKLALEYLVAPDTFEFWKKYENIFETNWRKSEKERNRKYYEKKKSKKIQKRTDKTD